MRANRILTISLLFVASGCYSYQATSLESLSPGEDVRLRLSQDEAARLQDLPLSQGRLLNAMVLDATGSELLFETTVGVNDAQRGTRALTQRVSVAFREIVEVEQRSLDRLRTGTLAGGAAALVGIVLYAQFRGSSGSDGPPDGGGINDDRWHPLIWFRLNF